MGSDSPGSFGDSLEPRVRYYADNPPTAGKTTTLVVTP
jgi:hypothetical protein